MIDPDILKDAIQQRYHERLLIDLGGILNCFLGYKLFRHGMDKGDFNFSYDGELFQVPFKVIFSGKGAGLFFAFVGMGILICALLKDLDIAIN